MASPQEPGQERLAEAKRYRRLIEESTARKREEIKALEAYMERISGVRQADGEPKQAPSTTSPFGEIGRGQGPMTPTDMITRPERESTGATEDSIINNMVQGDEADKILANEKRTNAVLELQKALVDEGYDIGDTGIGGAGVDGVLGPLTKAAAGEFFSPKEKLGETQRLSDREMEY